MPLPPVAACSPVELEARLRLHRLPDIGPKGFGLLLEAFGSAAAALDAPATQWRALGRSPASITARHSAEAYAGAAAAMAWLERPGQHLLMWDAPTYPGLLAELCDAPPLLFIAGDPTILEQPQLAIVGSRRASRPALDTAAAFSRQLAQAGS